MPDARFITAIGTPLTEDDRLHTDAFALHLNDQADAGIDSLLVAGTMGLLPLQTDDTWRDLVRQSVDLNCGRFEMLVGATDVSTSRALARVEHLNTLKSIDGVVIMAPGLFKFTQEEYIAYFTDLADASAHPIYLYDLQPLTGVHLSVSTVMQLATHRNIVGLKISANVPEAVRLQARLEDQDFRLIIAEPALSDMLLRHGYAEHLDGIYALAPHWAGQLAAAARAEDWETAAALQWKLTQIKELFLDFPFAAAFTTVMNLRGIPGRFAPRPMSTPSAALIEKIKERPIIHDLMTLNKVEA